VVTENEGKESMDEEESQNENRDYPLTTDFDIDGPNDAPVAEPSEDKEDTVPQDNSAKFLRWHH